ncbi:homocysteine S-methyltransferase family protein [Sphingomonas sp. DT-207]|uniref:homocysteine S-methyltransferase family protein n=1 Tax=Sphingomonas sp. DT-207 TaxID=3396167 RepID=UPI003F1A07FB
MPKYRHALPQLGGDLFLTDAGLETDLIFNRGIEIREFAAHTLLPEAAGRAALERYFTGFLELARETGAGFVLDTVTWKAHRHWAGDLGQDIEELRIANEAAVDLASALRVRFEGEAPIVINAVIGPRGDAYRPERKIAAAEAAVYYSEQLGWLADTDVDMVTGLTFNQSSEAAGLVQAATKLGLPVAISFTVETDGRLPDGQSLGDAIRSVDAQTGGAAAYFMVNCAHPDHFSEQLRDEDWARRIRGIRANASRRSHAELDEAPELDAGDPKELGQLYAQLHARMPWLNLFGACCGGDLRHVTEIASVLRPAASSSEPG